MRVVALVDGEHHPPVTRWALEAASARGYDVVAAILLGGAEKLSTPPGQPELGLGDVTLLTANADPAAVVSEAIAAYAPEAVLDLSDEPIVTPPVRARLAAVALRNGVAYHTADARFDPPISEPALGVPTVAVVGTGKRTGKTAVSAHLARLLPVTARPIIVAMGRGGPSHPTLTDPADVTLETLLGRAKRGEHAASDYLEDAVVARVPTVGSRRAAGGVFGRPFVTNVADAARLAEGSGAGLVILEGSGGSLPTVPWDAGVLVAPATLSAADLERDGGPLRLLLSDLIVFMLGVGPDSGPDDLSTLTSLARRLAPDSPVVIAELQPTAMGDVADRDVFFATTARGEVAVRLAEHLERTTGCRIVRTSAHLADRARLEEDLRSAPRFDVLLTELKAAAIDVAAATAVRRGARVVFIDNRPAGVGGDGDFDELLNGVVRLGRQRAAARGA
jgi:cyclic 2,3-diphosphoglycerate synthetase